jgi:hypothetical protein
MHQRRRHMIFELDAVHRFDAARGLTLSFNLRPEF